MTKQYKLLAILLASLGFISCSSEPKISEADASIMRGKALYEQCKICHGDRAEKSYMGEVPPIREIEHGARAAMMKAYRDGEVGKKGIYGLAELKGEVMLHLSDKDFEDLDNYIESLKQGARTHEKTSN